MTANAERLDDPRVDLVSRAAIAVAEEDVGAALRHFNAAADHRLPLVFWFKVALHDREFPPHHPGVQALWRRLWPDAEPETTARQV